MPTRGFQKIIGFRLRCNCEAGRCLPSYKAKIYNESMFVLRAADKKQDLIISLCFSGLLTPFRHQTPNEDPPGRKSNQNVERNVPTGANVLDHTRFPKNCYFQN